MARSIKAFLVKLGVYSDLEDLAIKWRLDVESFGNMDSIIDKFLSYKLLPTDHFTKDDIELFVQLLSLVKEKTLKKAELDKLRLNRIRGTPPQFRLVLCLRLRLLRLVMLFRCPSPQLRLLQPRLLRNLSLRLQGRSNPTWIRLSLRRFVRLSRRLRKSWMARKPNRLMWIGLLSCWNPLMVEIKLW